MFNKLFTFIIAANQIIIFITIIVIGVYWAMSLKRYSPEPNKVALVSKAEQKSDSKKTVRSKEFEYRINDVLIFTVRSEVIDLNAKHSNGNKLLRRSVTVSSKYRYNSDQIVNVMFVSEGKERRMLFENDRLITDIKAVNFKQEQRYDYILNKNLYTTVDTDSNGDGYLGEDDEETLYASDYNGEHLELILTGISKYTLIGADKVLITKGEKHKKQFYVYNVESGEIQPIDTDL